MGLLGDLRYFGPSLGLRRGSALFAAKLAKLAGKRRVAATLRRGESDAALLAALGLPADPAERQRRLVELWGPLRPLGAVEGGDDAAAEVRAGRQRLFGRSVEVGWPPRWDWRWDGDDNAALFTDDIRSTWEIQRLQGILPLARGGDAEGYLTALEDFHRVHPGPDGVAFSSALELGLRLVALAQGLPRVVGDAAWPRHDLVVLRVVDRHARLLAADLSLDKVVRGNHLLGELAGLVAAGHLVPTAHPRWWRNRDPQELLEAELLAQFHPDGVSVEQSIPYAKFILEFVAVAGAAAAARGRPFGDAVRERLAAALAHLDAATLPDGRLARIGDVDGGRGATWGESDPLDWRAAAPHVRSLLAVEAPPAPTGPRVATFADGGHVVVRHDAVGDMALFRAGPFGWGANGPASHSHADLLAPVLAVGGEALLVDPGVFGYRVAPPLRDAFRVAAAHTAVHPDPEPPPRPDGTFRWRDFRSRAVLVAPPEGAIGAAGEVDWTPAGVALRWRRVLTYNPIARSWSIRDSFSGSLSGPLTWGFRFAPGVNVSATATDGVFRAVLPSGAAVEIRLDPAGETEVGEDWVAPAYGTRVRAPVLRRTTPGTVTVAETTIVPA